MEAMEFFGLRALGCWSGDYRVKSKGLGAPAPGRFLEITEVRFADVEVSGVIFYPVRFQGDFR
jgi:hypothetical protein